MGILNRQKTVLIAGASGVIGQAAVEHFEHLDGWNVIAVSRRRPRIIAEGHVRHVVLDLTDPQACTEAVTRLPPITHLIYCAVYEKPQLVAGWHDREQMTINLAMLRNLVEPLVEAGALRHTSLLQGTKAYGAHMHAVTIPAREGLPRDNHENFYWWQEDYLQAQCERSNMTMTVLRPQIVLGDVPGVAMNLIPVIGAYAAIRQAEGRGFAFPGGPDYILEAVDARLLARVLAWAADAPEAANETFNVTNGDVFLWQNVWPVLADTLGVKLAKPEPISLAKELPAKAHIWRQIAIELGLRYSDLSELIGYSHHYADFCFAYGAHHPPPPVLVSTIKLRQAGFGGCMDTRRMFRELVSSMQRLRMLPTPRGTKITCRSARS